LPPDKQLHLLQTSILKRIDISLIEAVTGAEHGHIFLNYLMSENLFIVPMDLQHEWFQYHPLFREYLEEELITRFPDMEIEVRMKAGKCLEEKGFGIEAIEHYLQAKSYDSVLNILKRNKPSILHDEQFMLSNDLHKIPN